MKIVKFSGRVAKDVSNAPVLFSKTTQKGKSDMNEKNSETMNTTTDNNTTKSNTMKKAKNTRNTSKTLVELGPLAKVYGTAAATAYYARETQIKEMAKDARCWAPTEITRFHGKNWRLLLKGCTMPKFALDCYWNMIPVPETFSQSVKIRLAS